MKLDFNCLTKADQEYITNLIQNITALDEKAENDVQKNIIKFAFKKLADAVYGKYYYTGRYWLKYK